MALTASEEALVRQLLDQQAAILSLAGNEATITSKLGATKVTLADLVAASSLADADLLLTRQGTNDKSVRVDILAAYMGAEFGALFAPIANPTFTGDPKAPTAAQFDNDTSLATTAFVQRALGNMRGYRYVTTGGAITEADLGSFLYCAPTSPISLSIINSGTVQAGVKITVGVADYAGISPVTLTLATGLFVFFNQTTSSSLTLQRGQQIELLGDAGGNWIIVNGSGSASLSSSGYQKLPSGLIVQWGKNTIVGTGGSNFAYPIAFPSVCATLVGVVNDVSATATFCTAYNNSLTQGAFRLNTANTLSVHWIAIGY